MVYNRTTHDMKIRSVPAIALNQSNDHVGHYFMSLYTGKFLRSYQWKELLIDDDIISQLRELAGVEDAKKMTNYYTMFEWAPCVLMSDYVSE